MNILKLLATLEAGNKIFEVCRLVFGYRKFISTFGRDNRRDAIGSSDSYFRIWRFFSIWTRIWHIWALILLIYMGLQVLMNVYRQFCLLRFEHNGVSAAELLFSWLWFRLANCKGLILANRILFELGRGITCVVFSLSEDNLLSHELEI